MPAAAGSTPYTGTPIALPGTIEAENFDNGGATPGSYAFDVRVASLGAGGTFHIEVNGVDKTGPIAVPNTGDWQTWTTLRRTEVPLAPGVQVLRLVMDTVGDSTATGNFNSIRIEAMQASSFKITAPTPGSTLRAPPITFRWEGSGDEFWLRVGSAPGTADVYASAPLGPVNQHTVSRLPMDGRRLYVQLLRSVGGTTEAVQAEYTAPVRKGLAIITDFADRTLEDWTGNGFRSVDDLSVQLRNMEDPWAWLSRGLEDFTGTSSAFGCPSLRSRPRIPIGGRSVRGRGRFSAQNWKRRLSFDRGDGHKAPHDLAAVRSDQKAAARSWPLCLHFAFVAVNSPLTFIGCTLTVPAIFSAESSVPL
jgi:hypothetical protein